MSRPAHPMQLSQPGPGACAALCRLEAIELDRRLGVLVNRRASRVHGRGFRIGLHWQEARAGSAGRRRRPCHDPHLGQGACQALEDAVVLAKVLGGGGPDAYDRLRRPRAQMIIAWAHRIGAAARPSSPLAVRLPNMAARLLPRSSSARCLAPVPDWTA